MLGNRPTAKRDEMLYSEVLKHFMKVISGNYVGTGSPTYKFQFGFNYYIISSSCFGSKFENIEGAHYKMMKRI